MNVTDGKTAHSPESSGDKKHLPKTIHLMNNARRSLLMYPAGHDEITQSITTAYLSLSA